MLHDVFENIAGVFKNINISPVNLPMLWLESTVRKIASSTSYDLPLRRLCLESVTLLDTLACRVSKVPLADHSTPKGIQLMLKSFNSVLQDGEGIMRAIAD